MEVLENLVEYYHSKRISHAYLIETDNIDHCLEDLKIIVKKINCQNEYQDKCSKCNLCNLINQNYLPSFVIIEPSGSTIKKEQILELKKNFSSVPVYTNDNIYIIKNAEKLTSASANTMLKFVEEPEDNIIGFFITDNINNVITTIKSRCEILKVYYNEKKLDLSLLAQNDSELLNVALEYIKAIEVEKNKSIMYNKDILLVHEFERKDIDDLFNIILAIYEEALNHRINSKNSFRVETIDYLEQLTLDNILKRINLIIKFINDLNSNANIELLLDKFVIELSDSNE